MHTIEDIVKDSRNAEIGLISSLNDNLFLEKRLSYLNGHSATNFAAATSVVYPSHKCPQELYTARK